MSEKPMRVQLSNKRGAKLPPNTVIVTKPSRYKNPFEGGYSVAYTPTSNFRQWVKGWDVENANAFLAPLRGKNLACRCRLCHIHKDGKPLGVACDDCNECHADVLLEIANAEP